MTLPNQPASALAVLDNEEFFRIFQPVTSPGDFFEIDSSTRAIYLGPQSDVSEIRLQYFDVQATRSMSIADVSTGGPFVGRLDSLLATQYPGIAQPARIGAYPLDIVNPLYERPTDAMAVPLRRENIPPYIDLICALKNLPSIPTVRPDRTYRLKVPVNNDVSGGGDNGSTDLVIPIYGRRMVSVYLVTPAMVTNYHLNAYLVALQPGVDAPAKDLMDGGPVLVVSGTAPIVDSFVFRASDQFKRDAFFGAGTDSGGPFSWTENVGIPMPAVKGMGDLFVLNFEPLPLGPAPGYFMLDVVIKVSDTEEG